MFQKLKNPSRLSFISSVGVVGVFLCIKAFHKTGLLAAFLFEKNMTGLA